MTQSPVFSEDEELTGLSAPAELGEHDPMIADRRGGKSFPISPEVTTLFSHGGFFSRWHGLTFEEGFFAKGPQQRSTVSSVVQGMHMERRFWG